MDLSPEHLRLDLKLDKLKQTTDRVEMRLRETDHSVTDIVGTLRTHGTRFDCAEQRDATMQSILREHASMHRGHCDQLEQLAFNVRSLGKKLDRVIDGLAEIRAQGVR